MHVEEVRRLVAVQLEGRALLAHPFYRRWESGELAPGELARYAEQYWPVEAALPGVLRTVAAGLPVGSARDLVARNLADECDGPVPHVELFEGFARAVGASPDVAAGPAAAALVELEQSAATDPVAGIAVLAAYEVQAADIARSKADGLRTHYGIGPGGTRFWDVHATLEAEHAAWSLEALAGLVGDGTVVSGSVDRAAQAWWDFLDEREAEAAA